MHGLAGILVTASDSVSRYILFRGKWIVDSGATCHMCNDQEQFVEFRKLSNTQEVTLGDGHTLDGTGIGVVKIKTLLPDGNTQTCRLEKVLYLPDLSYNLLSVSKATEAGNNTNFSGPGCEIVDWKGKVAAFTTKIGSLYYLEYCRNKKDMDTGGTEPSKTSENGND